MLSSALNYIREKGVLSRRTPFFSSGCGFGLCYAPAIAVVSQYFDKRRSLAVGLAMSGGGFGAFVVPPLVAFLIENFSFRGMLFIYGAVFSHMCVAAALLRPHSFYTGPRPPKLRANRRPPAERPHRTVAWSARIVRPFRSPLLRTPALYLRGIPLAMLTDVLPYCYMMLPGRCSFTLADSIKKQTRRILCKHFGRDADTTYIRHFEK